MKNKLINSVHLEGLVYEHDLKIKTSGPNSKTPGTEFISGTVSIATDNDCLNIVPVHYTYVVAKTSKGEDNRTFAILKDIIDGTLGTVMKNGKENAAKVYLDTNIELNEFWSDRSGKEEFVSVKRNEGGFIHLADFFKDDETARCQFQCDMVITGAREVEADEEKNLPAKVIVKGAIFNFRKALLPVEFTAYRPDAMDYFMSLEASTTNPVFTLIKGQQVSETVVKKIEEPSAFGDPIIREVRNTRKDYVINWAAPTPYEWGSEGTMTDEDLAKAIADRETYLATLKQRNDEYKKSQASAAAPAAGGFQF